LIFNTTKTKTRLLQIGPNLEYLGLPVFTVHKSGRYLARESEPMVYALPMSPASMHRVTPFDRF